MQRAYIRLLLGVVGITAGFVFAQAPWISTRNLDPPLSSHPQQVLPRPQFLPSKRPLERRDPLTDVARPISLANRLARILRCCKIVDQLDPVRKDTVDPRIQGRLFRPCQA